jgi:hypothetical protein
MPMEDIKPFFRAGRYKPDITSKQAAVTAKSSRFRWASLCRRESNEPALWIWADMELHVTEQLKAMS